MQSFFGRCQGVALSLVVVSSLLLAGCGSRGGSSLGEVRTTRSAYGPDIPIGNGVGRSFVTVDDRNTPLQVGVELTPAALTGLTLSPADETSQFFLPMPAEANVTPYLTVILAYSSGHVPPHSGVDAVEPSHFHAVFMMNPPIPPTVPPTEDLPVATAEIPQDHVRVGQVVPFIGSAYDDPAVPLGYPANSTLGQGTFFKNGHMNAMHIGETVEALAGGATRGGAIKQPAVYAKPGLYPYKWDTYYDATRGTHVFLLSDFRRAGRTL